MNNNNNINNNNNNQLSMQERRKRLQELRTWVESTEVLIEQFQRGEEFVPKSSHSNKTWKKQVEEKLNEYEKWREHSFPGLIVEEGKEIEIVDSHEYKAYKRFLDELEDAMIEALVCMSLLEEYVSKTRRSKLH